jgi:hypothetical protein
VPLLRRRPRVPEKSVRARVASDRDARTARSDVACEPAPLEAQAWPPTRPPGSKTRRRVRFGRVAEGRRAARGGRPGAWREGGGAGAPRRRRASALRRRPPPRPVRLGPPPPAGPRTAQGRGQPCDMPTPRAMSWLANRPPRCAHREAGVSVPTSTAANSELENLKTGPSFRHATPLTGPPRPAPKPAQNISDLEIMNAVSQTALKIDFMFATVTAPCW